MSRIPKCVECGAAIYGGGVKIPLAKRGGRNGWLCAEHAHRLNSYSTENGKRRGVEKKHGFTFSAELETSYADIKARAELMDVNYIATADCTVSAEYKSPIYAGLNAVSKHCVTIENLIANGNMHIGNECGTHFHVGHVDYINPQTIRYLRRFNGSLFVPLSQAIMADTEKSARFFGRLPNGWSEPVTMQDASGNFEGWQMKHSAMFNLQHDYTIEFRQPKFINATQYMQVAKFARDCTNAIIENFIKHFNDTNFDTRRYPKRTDFRKHKAQVTAKKLVNLYEKYTANI